MMKVIVYLLGLGTIAIDACLILYTRETVEAIKALFAKFQLKYLSVIPAFFGLLFLISASATTYPWIFRAFGLLGFLEAVVVFTNPNQMYSRMLEWYFGTSDQTQRLFGIIGIILGTVFLSWIK